MNKKKQKYLKAFFNILKNLYKCQYWKKKFSGSKIFNKKKNNKYEKMNLEKKIEINIK